MELWDSAALQGRLWKTSLQLGASDPAERLRAIEVLSQAGSAAMPCLRFHLLRRRTPRVQFAAAVALHRLNAPEGMVTLLRRLNAPEGIATGLSPLEHRLNFSSDIAPLLEEALILVGSPAATLGLASFWPTLSEWQIGALAPPDVSIRVQLICRVWAGLQDPAVLDTLFAYSTRIPDLFPPTVAAFGQMATRKLRLAARSADPFQRRLVVRTLERIPGEPSFQTLVPLLRDPDPSVRREVCHALTRIGAPQANSDAVVKAIQAGYSTEEAVHLLAATGHPQIYETLLQLLERASSLYHTTQDTPAAVHVALDQLMQGPWSPESLLRIVCTLLEKPIPKEIVSAGIPHIAAFRSRCPDQVARAQGVLWNLLTDFAPEVRTQAAQALATWGEPSGKRFLELLAECRPQGSLLEKLTTLLRGGPDASQAATQAVRQVQQWVTRLSREAVVRLSSPTPTREPLRPPTRQDARVPGMTRRLLSTALRYLEAAQAMEETEEALALSVTAVRTLRRLGVPDALPAQPELLRALHSFKPLLMADGRTTEIGEPVREEAALALIEFLGTDSFALFIEALGATRHEVRGTAILALGRLGEARAVPYLQPIAFDPDSLLAPHALQALAVIRQNNPEMMTLLRGSSMQDTQPETLLRPLPFARPDSAPELLLRPTSNGETTP